MSVRIEVTTPVDVARVIEGLLLAATVAEESGAPLLCKAWTDLANVIGDALDRMPTSSNSAVAVALARRRITEYLASPVVLVNGTPRSKAS